MSADTMYYDWIIRENELLAEGNRQKFTAIPPANSRFQRRQFASLDAARKSIDRRTHSRVGTSADDDLLHRMLATRRRVKSLRQQLDAAIADALAAKKAFLAQDQIQLAE